jgi:hypothetical protein
LWTPGRPGARQRYNHSVVTCLTAAFAAILGFFRAMKSNSVYVGIDVACAVSKRLPICVVSEGHPIIPLMIPKDLAGLIPRGVGNREITAAAPFHEAARGVVRGINRIAIEMRWQLKRFAIDAPAAPPAIRSRASEDELGRLGLSNFRTPPASAGQAFARSVPIICGLAAVQQLFPMPIKSGCSSASSSSRA